MTYRKLNTKKVAQDVKDFGVFIYEKNTDKLVDSLYYDTREEAIAGANKEWEETPIFDQTIYYIEVWKKDEEGMFGNVGEPELHIEASKKLAVMVGDKFDISGHNIEIKNIYTLDQFGDTMLKLQYDDGHEVNVPYDSFLSQIKKQQEQQVITQSEKKDIEEFDRTIRKPAVKKKQKEDEELVRKAKLKKTAQEDKKIKLYKMPDGTIIETTYEDALKQWQSGKYGLSYGKELEEMQSSKKTYRKLNTKKTAKEYPEPIEEGTEYGVFVYRIEDDEHQEVFDKRTPDLTEAEVYYDNLEKSLSLDKYYIELWKKEEGGYGISGQPIRTTLASKKSYRKLNTKKTAQDEITVEKEPDTVEGIGKFQKEVTTKEQLKDILQIEAKDEGDFVTAFSKDGKWRYFISQQLAKQLGLTVASKKTTSGKLDTK